MKLKGLALLVLFPLSCHAQLLTVTGMGIDGESARHDAYRKAIEAKIGTIIVSEKEAQNYALIKNKILAHSAGYITQMKIINQSFVSGVYRVEMELEVSSSKLADIILSEGKTSGINAERDHTRVSTFMHQKNTGDRLVENVLKEYPHGAYKLSYSNYDIKYDTNRNIIFSVPYDMAWNYKFVTALSESLDRTKDESPGFFKKSASQITIMAKNPESFLLGERQTFSFNDDHKINLLHNTIAAHEPRIRLRVFDRRGKALIDECVVPNFLQGYSSAFYNIGEPYNIKIYGNNTNKNMINIGIHNHHSSLLNEFDSIKLEVVSKINCKF